jgi:signal transduction histidine kinase/ActR/RegA family two-component response regulator
MIHRRPEDESAGSVRARLEEAEQAIDAIRAGQVDAVVVDGPRGPQIYHLEGPDRPFQVFVDHMQQGALSLSCADTILYCNAFFADLVKTPLDQVMGRCFVDFLDGEANDRARALIERCITAPLSAEVVLRAHDGERIPAALSMIPIPGDPPTCCVTVSDLRVHERMREARIAQEAAEAANTAKDHFLAILSHELRTPLNTILGWAQILKRMDLGSEEVRKGIESIERNGQAQAKLISDLLDTSAIVAGKLRLDLRNVPIDEVVKSAVASVVPTAETQGLRIVTSLDAGSASVVGDPARLQQVMSNLLTNAVKHTDHPTGEIRVSTRRSGAGIEIEVSDNGHGISRAFLPRLFGLFQQEETATTRRSGGLGLGLAIVKRLVDLHGGTVRAESDGEGKGAMFTIWLPLGPETEVKSIERPVSREAPARPDLRGIRVLVVDDDSDARDLLRQMFAEGGAEVLVASGPDEGVRAVVDERPDVLVSDIAMPMRDGYDLLRELRVRGFSPESLPAIAISAFARIEDRDRAFAAGYQAHFAKPIDVGSVSAAIAQLARRKTS